MAKVVFSTMMSLDGFFESRQGKIDWVSIDEEIHRHANEEIRNTDLILLGRKLYETMRYWDTAETAPGLADFEHEFAAIWNTKPKMVFSRTLKSVGPHARLAKEDFVAELERLRLEGTGTIEVGGPTLAAVAMQLGLIDSYRMYIHPVLLGGGKASFGELQRPAKLKLTETRAFKSGAVLLRYDRAEAANA